VRRIIPIALLALAACREMPRDQYVALLTEAHDTMSARNRRLEEAFGLGRYAHWDWDQGAGVLVFSDGGVAKVVADVQFVGNVATRDSTFLWAWANATVAPRLQVAARRAREYGRRHHVARLRRAHWPANEVDGWEMTALAGFINGSQGAYRAPDEEKGEFTFLLMDRVRWAPPNSRVKDLLKPAPTPARR
jgi:hypothetical protein